MSRFIIYVGRWEGGEMGRWGDGKSGMWGDGNVGRWECGEMGRWGDGKVGRWEGGAMGSIGGSGHEYARWVSGGFLVVSIQMYLAMTSPVL